MGDIIKPITLEVDKKLWNAFKLIVPRNKTLNKAVIELIEKEVIKHEK